MVFYLKFIVYPTREKYAFTTAFYQTLWAAIMGLIAQGGTTLKDFVNAEGKPGYFAQSLNVYGRAGQPCYRCRTPIQLVKIGQRASYFCPVCQQ